MNLEKLYGTAPTKKTARATTFNIKKSEPPETKELLAASIVKVGEGFDALLASGLNRKAIEVLLYDATKVPKRDIRLILDGLRKLKGWYCK